MIKKILLIFIVVVVILYNLVVFYVDKNMPDRISKNIYDRCEKVWSSRGFYQTIEDRNSIKSLNEAFSLGYVGVEVDLFYDVKSDRFIISHDRPKKNKNGDLLYTMKENEILTLEKLLKKTGEHHYFWLDYKNLGRISSETTEKAIIKLLSITDFDSIRERIYIEGSDPLLLSMYSNAGFKTILGIFPLPESYFLSGLSHNLYKLVFYFSNITALAMNSGSADDLIYSKEAESLLKGVPVFLFHIPNNDVMLNYFLSKADSRVLLIDGAININRADMTACTNSQ